MTRKLTVTSIYGGRPYEPQIEALQKGVDVVVGTPGRLLDLAQQGHLQLGGLSMLVLDEADEMLDLGFLPDIERILKQIPDERQAMLFSATMPDPIITLARTFMNQPTHIRAEAPHSSAIHDTTEQFVYRAHALDKVELVSRILQAEGRGATMIFTRTKRTAQKVADELAERGFKVGAVHGDLGQAAREKALKAFRTGEIDVLVATDVAARGIDIDDVTHVINYQIPEDEQAYVHRIGRTGRAGKTGIAVTLVDWDELARWEMIDKALGLGCPDPAETYSSSPHLYEELGIPTDAKGTVGEPRKPQAKRAPRGQARRSARPQPHPQSQAHPRRQAGHRASPGDGRADRTRRGRRDRRRRRGERAPAGAVAVARARPRPRTPASRGSPPTDGQTRTPHQGRRAGGSGDRGSGRHRRRPDLVDQRRQGHHQPARRDARADAASRQGRCPAHCGSCGRRRARRRPRRWWWQAAWSPATAARSRAATPRTGDTRWTYARDLELCGVTYVYDYAVAVYPDVRGCGQVSTIDAKTGERGPSRTAYADPEVGLSSDGTTVLSAGDSRLEHVALGHGPDAVLRLARRPDQTGRRPPRRSAGWCRRRPAPRRCRCWRRVRSRPTCG